MIVIETLSLKLRLAWLLHPSVLLTELHLLVHADHLRMLLLLVVVLKRLLSLLVLRVLE